jgi:cobalt-zinc-cadmium efflux system outer membrane protein
MHYRSFVVILLFLIGHNLSAQRSYTISEVVSSARNNNPVLQTEKFNMNIASSDVTTAGLRPNPVFNNQTIQLLNSRYAPANPNLVSGTNRQIWYQVTKPMLLGNIRMLRVSYAKQSMVSASAVYSELNRNVSFDVAARWMDAWLLKTNLAIFKEAKENVDSLVYINEIRLRNEVITPIELIRTQLLSDQYNLQLKSLNNEYVNVLRNLKYISGINDSIEINDKISLVTFEFLENQDTLVSIALDRRSDLAYAKSNITLSKRNIEVQKAASLPYFEAGAIFNPQNGVPYAGTFATLSIPVFSRNQGEIEKSKFILRQSETYMQAKEMLIKMEVKNAYNSYITHKNNLKEFQDIVKKSARVISTVRYSYLKGNTTLIDFLDAQRTYLETQRLYNEAVFNFRKSYLEVLFTTGLIADI